MPPQLNLFIRNLIRNWKTTGPGLTAAGTALWSIYSRWQMGGSPIPTEGEFTALAAGVGLILAKAHDVTGGDKSNGMTPNPVQEANAQINVELAKPEPAPVAAPVDVANVIQIKQEMDAFGEKVKTEMQEFHGRLAKAMGPQ